MTSSRLLALVSTVSICLFLTMHGYADAVVYPTTGNYCEQGLVLVRIMVEGNVVGPIVNYNFEVCWDPNYLYFEPSASSCDFGAFPIADRLGGNCLLVRSYNEFSNFYNGCLFSFVLVSPGVGCGGPPPIISISDMPPFPLNTYNSQPIPHHFDLTPSPCAGCPPTPTPTTALTDTPAPPTDTPLPPTDTPASPTDTPLADDIDRDGVTDANEDPNITPGPGRSNIWLADSDGDGLLDGQEDEDGDGIQGLLESSTRNRDTDGDQYRDSIERMLGTDALVFNGGYADADGDGWPDSVDEFDGKDRDGDRFTDGYEAGWFRGYGPPANASRYPPMCDANGDGQVTNLDALLTQSLFLGLVLPTISAFDTGPNHDDGFRYLDANSDGSISNLDALIANSFFLEITPFLPLAF